jgi:predicted RNA binding protein YcfA (HicA-like mRNA interferase family)
MSKYDRIIQRILSGKSDANVAFDDVCLLLRHLGFEERVRGSHHIFRKAGVEEKLNLQESGGKAKPYQVRQIRAMLSRYTLTGDD